MPLNIEQALAGTTSSDEILKILIDSKDNGTAVGLTALSLGPTIVMTAVDDIIDVKNDKIVLLKELDLLGIRLPESELLLSEIVKVYPLKTKYYDPFHVHLREHRREDF